MEELSAMNDPNKVSEIRELKNSINILLHQDELFWRQRSRSIWLPTGDKNIKYFHQRASLWHRKNHMVWKTKIENGLPVRDALPQ